VLSLGIAAIAATWLPFSFLYINALSKHAATVTATPATPATVTATPATVTATSATAAAHSSGVAARPAAATLATVTTRTS
jgi:hypothetical protein